MQQVACGVASLLAVSLSLSQPLAGGEPVAERGVPVIWSDVVRGWLELDGLSRQRPTPEVMARVQTAAARLLELVAEVAGALEPDLPERAAVHRAARLARQSLAGLERTASLRIPGALPALFPPVHDRLWYLQRSLPEPLRGPSALPPPGGPRGSDRGASGPGCRPAPGCGGTPPPRRA